VTRQFFAVLGLVLVVLLFSARRSAGEQPKWVLHVWQLNEGLPNNMVTGVEQTPDGYLWVSTRLGIVRFDGVRFESFDSTNFLAWPNRPDGPDRGERVMIGSRDGGLWLALDPGMLIHIAGGKALALTNTASPTSVPENMIEDNEGTVWINYRFGALITRVQNGKVSVVGAEAGVPAQGLCSFAKDTNGCIWFAKGGELGVIRHGKFQTLTRLDDTNVSICSARDGGVWGCSATRLFKYREGGVVEELGSPGLTSRTTTLLEDRDGALWIGTFDSGLFRYDGSEFERVPTSDRDIICLSEDRQGNLWVGTGGGGLNQIRACAVEVQNADHGSPFEAVQSLALQTNGVLWAVGQNDVAYYLTNGVWKDYPLGHAIGSEAPACVAVDDSDSIWIGTTKGTVHHIRGGEETVLGRTEGIYSGRINALLPDHAGNLWIAAGTSNRLQCLRNGVVNNITLPSGRRAIRYMVEDAQHNIWLGSTKTPGDHKGLIIQIVGDKIIDESEQRFAPTRTIRCMILGEDGNLWVAASGGNLARFKDGKFAAISIQQGLLDDNISQIVDDGRGWLWFGSDHGLFKARLQELNDVADGRAQRLQSVQCGRDEGLPSVQGNNGTGLSSLRDNKGRLWIAMRSALVVIDPSKMRVDLNPPPVLISRVIVDGKTVASHADPLPVNGPVELRAGAAGLKVPPNHRRLEFEFSALSFRSPENVQFRYQLLGYDENWIEAGTRRSAYYSRLPAGRYSFRVKACNSDGIWNEGPAVVGFDVVPFFWQTWWFELTAIFVFTSAIVAVVRYASFRRLRSQLEKVEHQAALDKSHLAGMAEVATSVLHNVGNVLNSVNISQTVVSDKVRNSKVTRLGQVTALLDEHSRDLPGFFASHPKGQKLPAYLAELSRHLEDERKALLEELSSLGSNIEHINEIVARQQSYARVGAISESLNLADLVEDAIRFDTASMERDHIQVVREFAKVAPITADKHKVLQILINLISNARYAVNESGTEVKRITVRIEPNGSQWVKVSVIDNGLGIPAENLTRIFQQGFSTRKNGHGFGLHGSAVAAKQMGGSLIAQSDGPGKGACFVLELPLQTEKAAARQQAAAVAAARN